MKVNGVAVNMLKSANSKIVKAEDNKEKVVIKADTKIDQAKKAFDKTVQTINRTIVSLRNQAAMLEDEVAKYQ